MPWLRARVPAPGDQGVVAAIGICAEVSRPCVQQSGPHEGIVAVGPTKFFRLWIVDERTGKRRLIAYTLKRRR